MKKILFMLCLLPLGAQAFMFVDPVNLVQNTIVAINSISSLINQAKSIQMQLEQFKQNGQHLGQYHYQDMGNMLQKLASITRQGQSLSYAMQNVDRRFQQLYPNYDNKNVGNYQQAYQSWNQTTLTTLQNSLQAIGTNVNSIQQEERLMQQLHGQSQGAQGRMQVLQVANEMSAENIRQLNSLKHLIAAQANAQNAYMAKQVSQRSYQQQSLHELVAEAPQELPAYHNNPRFGKIKVDQS